MKKPKFRIGDVVIRKELPQYEGKRIIVTITAIDDEYYYCGHDDKGYVRLFSRSAEDQFELYRKPSAFSKILNLLKKLKEGKV